MPARFEEALALVVLGRAVAHPPARLRPGDLCRDQQFAITGKEPAQGLESVVVQGRGEHHGDRALAVGREAEDAPPQSRERLEGGTERVAPFRHDVRLVDREQVQPALGR